MKYSDKPPYVIYAKKYKDSPWKEHHFDNINAAVRFLGYCSRFRMEYTYEKPE